MEDLRKTDWVSFYRPIFVNHLNVNATFLATLRRVVSTEEASTLVESSGRETAVTRFIGLLHKVQNKHGIFDELCDALKSSEQDHIEEMIRKGQSASSDQWLRNKHLIRQYQRELTKRVNPCEILVYLKCLTTEEINGISSCTDCHGEERGALKILSYLVLKGNDMLEQLLTGLRETGHGEVADQLTDEMAKEKRRIKARRQPNPDVEEFFEEWKGVDDLECCTDVDVVTAQVASLKITSGNCTSTLKPKEEGSFSRSYTCRPPVDDNLDFFDASESLQVYEEENADNEDIEKARKRSDSVPEELSPNCATANTVSCDCKQPQETSFAQSKLQDEEVAKSNGRKKRRPQKQRTLPVAQATTEVTLRRDSSVKLPKVRRHPDQLRSLSTTEQPSSKMQTNEVSGVGQVASCVEEAVGPSLDCLVPVEPVTAVEIGDNELTPDPDKLQTPNSRVFSGDVIEVKTGWVNNCCQECTRNGSCSVDEESKRLVCGTCGACYQDKSKLVQRQFAEVTLKTEGQETITKMCYHRELKKFFKDNGDKISDHRSNQRLAAYLKDQESLKLVIDEKSFVKKILKC